MPPRLTVQQKLDRAFDGDDSECRQAFALLMAHYLAMWPPTTETMRDDGTEPDISYSAFLSQGLARLTTTYIAPERTPAVQSAYDAWVSAYHAQSALAAPAQAAAVDLADALADAWLDVLPDNVQSDDDSDDESESE